MALRLTAKLEQRMVLTPQLRQRIEMLQMTSLELTDLVQTELLSNPILEEVQPQDEVMEISEEFLDQYASSAGEAAEGNSTGESADITAGALSVEAQLGSLNGNGDHEILNGNEIGHLNGFETDSEFATGSEGGNDGNDGDGESGFGEENQPDAEARDAFEEVDYGREFQEYLDPGYKTQEIEYKEDEPSFDQFLSRAPSLGEHLGWQLNLQCTDDHIRDIALAVIGNLDNDGRLTATVEEIADLELCSVEDVEIAREMVMQLDPVGCGARDVSDCLLAQLRASGEGESLAAMLVKDHLPDLQPHRLQHLAKSTGHDLETLNDQLKLIRTLDPYPGRRYSSEEAIFVAPEVYVEKLEDDYVIYFVDDGSPRLRISPTYQQLLEQNGTSKETRDFIKDKVRSAVDLLRNIEHRRQTIYRVVECIIHRQRDFLDKGVEYIKPMMLKDVAEDIGMHLSTISRVVNRKYAHTPQGVIELRRFFSEGMMNEDGEEVSTRIIKLKIKKLIEEEDTKNPITDDEMAKILSKEGIKLSRRTVAKYRDQMQIVGSRERKTVI
jgi:RNA polymerase sigma-54 factor